jgi:hypothetical protein
MAGQGSLYGTGPDADGWYHFMGIRPSKTKLCQFYDTSAEVVWVGYADFPPEFNIANLKWRLTEIGKEQP